MAIFLPVDLGRFGSLKFVQAEASTRDGKQSVSSDGVPQWTVRCLHTPVRGRAGMVEVMVPSSVQPDLPSMAELTFRDFGAMIWRKNERQGYFFIADAVAEA